MRNQCRHSLPILHNGYRYLALVMGLASGLLMTNALFAEDDYMRSIRSEAATVEKLDQHASSEKSEQLLKDFESALLLDSPNSYRLYQQLKPEGRMAVFQNYSKTKDLQSVQRQIIDLRLGN